MLEKPDVPDHLLISTLQAEYELHATQVTFLPLGYDVNTAVYRVDTSDHASFFLKLRLGDFTPVIVDVPQFLSVLGIPTIIPPLHTQEGHLFGRLENYRMILYPFISGNDGYQVKLIGHHWVELGRTLKRVHAARVPSTLLPLIPRETFNPVWRDQVKQFQAQVDLEAFNEPVAQKLSTFLRAKQSEIRRMLERANELAASLCQQPLEFVLCHSDAHPGNFLITDNSELYLVDWDNPIFAPRERDLMFFGSGMSGDQPGGVEEGWFYHGYGEVEVNQPALAYYRYERIIQDIAEFCKQIISSTAGGEDREQSYVYCVGSFSPGGVVDGHFIQTGYMGK